VTADPTDRPAETLTPHLTGDEPESQGARAVRRILSRQAPAPDGGQAGLAFDRVRDGDQLDLADRQALRRVEGLSTELEDVSEVEYRRLRLERVVLAGLWGSGTVTDAEVSLHELAALAETAGSVVLDGVLQRRENPDPSTFLGSGKAEELRALVASTGADTVICDGELSPSQRRGLEDVVKVKVIDRTGADPGHLRPARQEQGGQGAGRARPARVPAAAPARLG